jgi:hypothetical protein
MPNVLELRGKLLQGHCTMNGTVIFGVCLIASGLFFSGYGMLPMLAIGIVVIAYGAFAPAKSQRSGPRRLPYDDRYS